MSLTDQTLSLVAFKNLQGKSHTDNAKGLGNEAEGIFLNVAANAVFMDTIDEDPSQAVIDGIAELVQADLTLDPTSNGHAYFASYPTGHPLQGERITNAINPSYGFQYEAKPFASGVAIPVNDPRDWIYQYQSGVFYQQDVVGASPTTIDLYVYTGQLLSEIDFNNNINIGGSSAWQDPVITRIEDETSIISPTLGDRYLIIDGGSCGTSGIDSCLLGEFVGHENEIAEWSLMLEGTNGTIGWAFTEPTDGMTVKVNDEDGFVYHYEDTVFTLGWQKYSYGQVRVLNAIGTDDYTGSISPQLDYYREDVVYLSFFSNQNTGPVTLDIDGMGQVDVKKSNADTSGTALIDLEYADLRVGVAYVLTFDGIQFQLASNGAGGAIGVIGEAEDGTYEDGLFTDFTPDTPIGTAVDRFNEVLKALAPPPAPDLSDWSATLTNDVTGKLSFDTPNPIPGYVPADTAPSNPISADGTWTIGDVSGKRLGIKPEAEDITGVLNDQVVEGPGDPTPAYPENTFGDGEKGTLTMTLNGFTVSTIDLTSSTGAISDSTAGTGLSVSAQDTSKFPSGAPLDLFIYRTGTWSVASGDANLTNGYNYVIVEHDTGSVVKTLDRYEFVIDDSTTATSYSAESFSGLSMTGSKKLSGVDYHTGGTVGYNLTIDNAYRNTYSSSASAISHTGNSNTYGLLLSASSEALPAQSGDEAAQVVLSSKVTTFTGSGRRILDETVSLTTTVDRTVQADITSTGASIGGILLDNIAASSTDTSEGFDDEDRRLLSNSTYDNIADVTSNPWDSDQSVNDGAIGHTDGLQIIDGKMVYPGNIVSLPSDFRTTAITNGSTFNDGGVGGTGRDYTALTGDRTYYRYFRQVTPTTANFIMNISGSGGTFVATGTALTGSNIHVEIKAPTETGWMDAYSDFSTGQFGDGDGARSATDGAGRGFGANWGLTIGTKSTANTGGYVVVRITVGASFTGEFTGMTFNFN
jgi:hypothetical protein